MPIPLLPSFFPIDLTKSYSSCKRQLIRPVLHKAFSEFPTQTHLRCPQVPLYPLYTATLAIVTPNLHLLPYLIMSSLATGIVSLYWSVPNVWHHKQNTTRAPWIISEKINKWINQPLPRAQEQIYHLLLYFLFVVLVVYFFHPSFLSSSLIPVIPLFFNQG